MAAQVTHPGIGEPIKAKPVEARLYRNGCQITFACEAELTAGQHDVLVDCVPRGCEEEGTQVRVPDGITLLSASVEELSPMGDHGEVASLEEEVASLEEELLRIHRRMATRSEQRDRWLAPGFSGSSKAALDALAGYLDGLSSHLDALDDEIGELDAKRRETEGRLKEAKSRLESARIQAHRKVLRLHVSADGTGRFPFEVSMRGGAGTGRWMPSYDVVVRDFKSPLEVWTRAEIQQSTGFAWEGVKVTLSTAAPVAGQELPYVRPVRVSCPRPVRISRMTDHMSLDASIDDEEWLARKELEEQEERAMRQSPLARARAMQAAMASLANSREYEVPGTWDIADGGSATLDISTTEVEAEYRWLAVPEQTGDVHIVAYPEEPIESLIIGHEVSLYVGGEYCGKAKVPKRLPGDPSMLPLGKDTMMVATSWSRESVSRSGALIGGKDVTERIVTLDVESSRSESVRIDVLSRVPVSEDSGVSVTVSDGFDGSLDKETGEVRWEVDLPARGHVRKELGYGISYPKGEEIRERHV